MRFHKSAHGNMFFLPRPSEDHRDEQERRLHWLEVQMWCLNQFGAPQQMTHNREITTWKHFGLYRRVLPDERHLGCDTLYDDLLTGIYFAKPDDAFAFKMRWG